jgi:SAM-dependent methyltransferase
MAVDNASETSTGDGRWSVTSPAHGSLNAGPPNRRAAAATVTPRSTTVRTISVSQLHEQPFALSLCSGVLAEVQRTIRHLVATLVPPASAPRPRLLDIGCWDGSSTAGYGESIGGATLSGIEIFDAPARAAEARGIDVARLDLEKDAFPWDAGTFDVVVANQVFEHLKNIWLPLSEAYRTLRVGGHLVISVPNLASLHNRVLLAMGRQPTSIRTLGPHVRGYTLSELVHLLEMDGALSVQRVSGVGFYPLPARIASPLARIWNGGSHTPVVLARKVSQVAVPPWEAYRRREIEANVQTFYG